MGRREELMAVSERFQGANIVNAGRLSPYWGEHAARYVFALDHVADRRVLDIACGTGYGIGVLGSKARFILGIDIDTEAAKEALRECGSNAGVSLADGLQLPLTSESVDVVTSFETLEHLHNRSGFLAELARVMRRGATLVLSTPNAYYTEPVNGVPENPFHIHEYTPEELRREIEAHFMIDRLLGQSLDSSAGTPPFLQAQRKLPNDIGTQTRLFGWKVLNKLPVGVRESLSELVWSKPFYPTEMDYNFSEATVNQAPTLIAICRKA